MTVLYWGVETRPSDDTKVRLNYHTRSCGRRLHRVFCLRGASVHHGDIKHTLLLRALSYGQAVERVLLNCFLMQPCHFNCAG